MTAPAPIWSERPGPDRDGGPGTDRRTRTPSPSRPQAQRPPPPGEATQAAPPARAPPGLPSRSDDVTGWRRLRGLPLAQVDSVASLVALLSGQKLFVIYISEKRPVNRALVSSFSRLECLLIPMRLGGPLGSDSHRLRPTSEPLQRSAGHPKTPAQRGCPAARAGPAERDCYAARAVPGGAGRTCDPHSFTMRIQPGY